MLKSPSLTNEIAPPKFEEEHASKISLLNVASPDIISYRSLFDLESTEFIVL
jgi:hypothetical protein